MPALLHSGFLLRRHLEAFPSASALRQGEGKDGRHSCSCLCSEDVSLIGISFEKKGGGGGAGERRWSGVEQKQWM